ncbi:B3 domain-containing protein REM8-like isoform X1 [Nicotiana tabacum]|uniref:B3 domain-containing protein REM10-like isoform X1 n=4 Tax=Nicotiana TaxID=4085 RepID=A0A1S4BWV0_TOBAC|nr:PREDICTED: B3 domain-containing protein REM10-like isoform X1 [Nicotiana sylvestris]XP_016493377.1 PREDICTED: B3 domain-containing protein REM10-like isoform X1 [Nicotiana tabacum]
MKVRPVKPHFFKPIQPGFKQGLNIPVGFLKYLTGHEHEHAVLKRAGKKWQVKVNGRRLEEGWEKFAEEHDLQLGDMLVFRHDGNMEFEVVIFDSSHCDREYAENLQEEEEEEEEGRGGEEEQGEEANFGQSLFECTVRSYWVSNGYLFLPKQFALANSLTNKNCGLIIRDESQRPWNLRLATYRSRVCIVGRWKEFIVANDLKVGECIMFEVVNNGEKPIWQFHVKPNPIIMSSRKAFPNEESANHSPSGQSLLLLTVKPYFLTKGYLRLPMQFARANGLTNKNCGLIISDETQRRWNLRLATYGSQVCIVGGWNEFHAANDLKVGDCIMFEVVTNGDKPIRKFYGKPNPSMKSSSKAFPYAGTDTHKPFSRSHFVCTVRPYYLSNDLLYIPKQFALANGLTNKKCDLIIRDELQRSWNVRLCSFGNSVFIRGGWHEFRNAKCLKEGDCIMFELVTNGNRPILKFNGKISGEDTNVIQGISEQ